jgi:hypothetical protein
MLSRIGDSLQTVIEVSGCPEQHPRGSLISVSTASKQGISMDTLERITPPTIWFIVASLASFGLMSFWRALSWRLTGGEDGFYQLGQFWILIKSIWYGLVLLFLHFAILSAAAGKQAQTALNLVIAITLALADYRDPLISEKSPLDRYIGAIGYATCRVLFPYTPRDRILAKHARAVIAPNTCLVAQNGEQKIEIAAGRGALRTIRWQGEICKIEVTPENTSIDNRNSYKLLYPDYRETNRHRFVFNRQFWNLHNGVTAKCDYSESIENFATEREAIEFLKEEFACMPGVLTNRGLVVNWSNHCDEETLSITVRKILIKGKEPKRLPNGNDSAIAAHPHPHPVD